MDKAQQDFENWQDRERLAEEAMPLIGGLYRERGAITLMYGRPLMYLPPLKLLQEHRYVAESEGNDFSILDTQPLLKVLATLPLDAARYDLGRLAMRWRAAGRPDVDSFLRSELKDALSGKQLQREPQDIVLYGFGRIGRLVTRLMMERAGNGEGMRLRAVVVRKGADNDLEKRASLLERDSVHGGFKGTVEVDHEGSAIIANGHRIRFIYSDAPDKIDYTQYGLHNAVICDNTGKWRDDVGLGLHLKSTGARKVLLTAPGKGAIKNIVCGVNDNTIADDDTIVSAASCTTNATVPVLKSINDRFGIVSGHIESVHSYTNDQNLIDNFHKADRRGRSAPLNMVLASTGAASAVAKALPELAGKLTGNAIRVPTPNVSMAVLMLNLRDATDKATLNAHLRYAASESPLHKQIAYWASSEIASTDIVGTRHTAVIDSGATIVDGNRCVVYCWYDNEFGYSVQVVRVLQRMAGIHYDLYPAAAG